MLTVYGFPLSADEIIRAETRHEVIDRIAEEAKAELREMIAGTVAEHHAMLSALDAAFSRRKKEAEDAERRARRAYDTLRNNARFDQYGNAIPAWAMAWLV